MQQVKNPAASIALRVATAMHQMGIDGLPRNYELVYEAYSGSNPELVREFIALGVAITPWPPARLRAVGTLQAWCTTLRGEVARRVFLLR